MTILDSYSPISIEELRAIEDKIGTPFPEDFARFLIEVNVYTSMANTFN